MPLKECIIYRQYSTNECLFVRELFSTFTTSCVAMHLADIQKVFSHCPYMKMLKFSKEKGWTNSTHFLFRIWQRTRSVFLYSISIQVWGIASFIFSQVIPQPSCR